MIDEFKAGWQEGRDSMKVEVAQLRAEIEKLRAALAAIFTAAIDEYDPDKDVAGSLEEAYRAIRERMAAGGPGWKPKEP